MDIAAPLLCKFGEMGKAVDNIDKLLYPTRGYHNEVFDRFPGLGVESDSNMDISPSKLEIFCRTKESPRSLLRRQRGSWSSCSGVEEEPQDEDMIAEKKENVGRWHDSIFMSVAFLCHTSTRMLSRHRHVVISTSHTKCEGAESTQTRMKSACGDVCANIH